MFSLDAICFESLTQQSAIAACLSLAVLYVGSLYVWTSNLPRDHPQTIKERFRRVILTCFASIFTLVKMSDKAPIQCSTKAASVWLWLGIRTESIFMATTVPLLLFMILFLGPIYMTLLEEGIQELHPKRWMRNINGLRIIRNYLVAPFSEELVFRGCMLPLLLPVFGAKTSIILAPSFFGIAHIHHAQEKYYRQQYPLGAVAISTLFQAFYTTLFGALSSWLFLRTGHLTSVVVCHAFCNMMGFPDFAGAMHHEKRLQISFMFILGLVSFFYLANPLTEPTLYENTLYGGHL